MHIWTGWASGQDAFVGLDLLATMILHEGKTEQDMDKGMLHEIMKTEEGRLKIATYCINDRRLTYRLWEKMNGTLFAG